MTRTRGDEPPDAADEGDGDDEDDEDERDGDSDIIMMVRGRFRSVDDQSCDDSVLTRATRRPLPGPTPYEGQSETVS